MECRRRGAGMLSRWRCFRREFGENALWSQEESQGLRISTVLPPLAAKVGQLKAVQMQMRNLQPHPPRPRPVRSSQHSLDGTIALEARETSKGRTAEFSTPQTYNSSCPIGLKRRNYLLQLAATKGPRAFSPVIATLLLATSSL